ncbi:MAG: TAXI family TRAP transporter solute-binding subunit [Xanthobacteraceae bacterium]
MAVAFSISPIWAQSGRGAAPIPDKPNLGSIGERINANTIAIVSGNLNATYLSIAYDLSAVLDDGDNFRVLPVIGKGGGQNLRDVRFLKGVDLGITQSILLNNLRRSNEIGKIDDKIVYLAKLFNEEMHVVVRADSGIESLEQLAGKKVNFSDIGSGTQLSTRDIFQRLKIPAQEVNMGQADAFVQLKSGEIAATVLIAGKPAGAMAKLKAAEGFRFLPIPFAKPLQDDYLPAALSKTDYPGMVSSDEGVETVAVSAVLIAYNWPKGSDRYRRIEKFVQQFFPKIAEFQKPPRHPKWRETNLAATLPGWTRFPAAEEWLQRHKQQQQQQQQPVAANRDSFKEFLATRGAAAKADEQERLFQEFLKWSQARERR